MKKDQAEQKGYDLNILYIITLRGELGTPLQATVYGLHTRQAS